MRRALYASLLALGFVLVFCTGPIRAGDKEKSGAAAPFVHVVIFHLKPDAAADAAEGLIADAHEMLAKIPTVREVCAGKPAPKTGIAKSDYQVGLLVRFDDIEGLKTYDKHPLHVGYVKKHGKNIQLDKIAVFDFIDQKK
jgi:hypothetical protein